MEPKLLGTRFVIVGGSAGRDLANHYRHTDWNVWCVARIYNAISFATLVFDMHQESARWTSNTHSAYRDRKLIMQNVQEPFVEAYQLPTKELVDEFGTLTSSFAWMIAYALYLGATEIVLCGVNMIHESELLIQRPGLFYLLGYARAKGVKITVPYTSQLRTDILFSTN